jgi:hypothetical protein
VHRFECLRRTEEKDHGTARAVPAADLVDKAELLQLLLLCTGDLIPD